MTRPLCHPRSLCSKHLLSRNAKKFDQCLRNDVLVEPALVHVEDPICPQVIARLVIQHGHEKAAVAEVQLVLRLVIVAFEWQLRIEQAVARVHHARARQPLDAAPVVLEKGAPRQCARASS